MRTLVKDLPASISAVIRELGCGKADIEFEIIEKISPHYSASDGCRGVFAMVDIATGKSQIAHGDWGGANFFSQKLVDLLQDDIVIPENVAVIKGQVGGVNCLTLYLNPINAVKLLPPASENLVNKAEACCLYAHKGLKPAYRKGTYTAESLESCIQKKLITRNKVGTKVTVEGRNAFEFWCDANNQSKFSMPR